MSMRIAAPQQQKIRPAFTVTPLKGEREQEIIGFDAKGVKQVQKVKVPAGYLVKFAKGHSIRVRNDEELRALGFDKTIPLVDGENIVGEMPNMISALVGDDDDEGNE